MKDQLKVRGTNANDNGKNFACKFKITKLKWENKQLKEKKKATNIL